MRRLYTAIVWLGVNLNVVASMANIRLSTLDISRACAEVVRNSLMLGSKWDTRRTRLVISLPARVSRSNLRVAINTTRCSHWSTRNLVLCRSSNISFLLSRRSTRPLLEWRVNAEIIETQRDYWPIPWKCQRYGVNTPAFILRFLHRGIIDKAPSMQNSLNSPLAFTKSIWRISRLGMRHLS